MSWKMSEKLSIIQEKLLILEKTIFQKNIIFKKYNFQKI